MATMCPSRRIRLSEGLHMTTSDAMAASTLVSSATMAGLLRCLVQKGVLQAADITA